MSAKLKLAPCRSAAFSVSFPLPKPRRVKRTRKERSINHAAEEGAICRWCRNPSGNLFPEAMGTIPWKEGAQSCRSCRWQRAPRGNSFPRANFFERVRNGAVPVRCPTGSWNFVTPPQSLCRRDDFRGGAPPGASEPREQQRGRCACRAVPRPPPDLPQHSLPTRLRPTRLPLLLPLLLASRARPPSPSLPDARILAPMPPALSSSLFPSPGGF